MRLFQVNSQSNQKPIVSPSPQPSATRSITRNGRSRCASLNRRFSTMRPRSNCCASLLFPLSPTYLLIVSYHIVDRRRTTNTRRRWRTFISRMVKRCSRMPLCRILFWGRSRRVAQRQKKVRVVSTPGVDSRSPFG
jgi:hypothetical protein